MIYVLLPFLTHFRHPLFPLLSLLLEKCEIATNSLDNLQLKHFNEEAKHFIFQKLRGLKEVISADPEVNELVVFSNINKNM